MSGLGKIQGEYVQTKLLKIVKISAGGSDGTWWINEFWDWWINEFWDRIGWCRRWLGCK